MSLDAIELRDYGMDGMPDEAVGVTIPASSACRCQAARRRAARRRAAWRRRTRRRGAARRVAATPPSTHRESSASSRPADATGLPAETETVNTGIITLKRRDYISLIVKVAD